MNRALLAAVFLLSALPSAADDVWLLRVRGNGAHLDACRTVRLNDMIVFQNTTATPRRITFLGVSAPYGVPPEEPPVIGARDLDISPGRTVSVGFTNEPTWESNPQVGRWVTHLDIPHEVLVESRLELGFRDCAGYPPQPPTETPYLGKVELPVYRALTPPGRVQRLLGTDNAQTQADITIGVYNAGSNPAMAHVSVYRACDDAAIADRLLTVPPNTLVETAVARGNGCAQIEPSAPWIYYTLVTVDQPSLSYALTTATGVATVGVSSPATPVPTERVRGVRRSHH